MHLRNIQAINIHTTQHELDTFIHLLHTAYLPKIISFYRCDQLLQAKKGKVARLIWPTLYMINLGEVCVCVPDKLKTTADICFVLSSYVDWRKENLPVKNTFAS